MIGTDRPIAAVVTFLWWAVVALALPTWMQDNYMPDLITAVNQESSGGHYYLRSSAPPGDEGHTVVRKYWDVAAYSKENEEFAPKFFIRGGDLYSMTNNTHMLRVAIHNQTDPDVKYPVPNYDDNGVVGSGDSQQTRFVSGPKQRYKLKLVETSKFDRNVGVGEGKYLAGSWAWHGPILVYTFHLTGSLFYSCWDGVYLDVQLGLPAPSGCEIVTLHARNILLSWR